LKKKIIYYYPSKSTFVQKDIDLLSEKYSVSTQNLPWVLKDKLVINFIKQFIFLFKNTISSSVIFVMFGGYWSFLPALFGKIFHKPVFIILGGTDCVSFPEIGYGSLRKQPLKYFIQLSYKWCTKLLPVDQSLIYHNYTYRKNIPNKTQGFKAFIKKCNTHYEVIPNGFDIDYWESTSIKKNKNTCITVANINDKVRVHLKGIDVILKLANQFKQVKFAIVGISLAIQKELEIPENVICFEFLKQDDFKEILQQSEFYLQLSLSEGFPNALAEAMLCKCIPFGSQVGAIPSIISDSGIIIKENNDTLITEKFKELINLPAQSKRRMRDKAYQQISLNYNLIKRKKAFYKLIDTHL